MILIILYILTAWLINLVLPWWSIAIPGLILGYQFKGKAGKSFGAGFLALFLLWFGQAVYIHLANDGILSSRVAEMLQPDNPWVVILFTGLIGGLVGGLSLMTGSLFRSSKLKGES